MATLRNPIEWAADQIKHGAEHADSVSEAVRGEEARGVPQIKKIDIDDLKAALRKGVADFGAGRTDVIFLCIVYPIAGLVMARFILQEALLPLLFPVISGFALIGPVAAVGLYEISRRRERGEKVSWASAFGVLQSPAFGAIFVLGLILVAIFLAWMVAAHLIYRATLGPEAPASISAFLSDVLTTGPGWTMTLVGLGVGFLFALLVLSISALSFPALLDRKDLGVVGAIRTSLDAIRVNPRTMAVWGLIVAGGLVLGSLPIFLGLIYVMPVLGHATWHLYRKAVA